VPGAQREFFDEKKTGGQKSRDRIPLKQLICRTSICVIILWFLLAKQENSGFKGMFFLKLEGVCMEAFPLSNSLACLFFPPYPLFSLGFVIQLAPRGKKLT
jgi:hypothetical protein